LKKVVYNRRGSNAWWTETFPSGGNTGNQTNPPASILIRIQSNGAANPTFTTRRSTDNGATWQNTANNAANSAFTVPGDASQPIYMALVSFQSVGATGSDRSAGFDFIRVMKPEDAAPDGQPPTECVPV